jgi:hypothetical protein
VWLPVQHSDPLKSLVSGFGGPRKVPAASVNCLLSNEFLCALHLPSALHHHSFTSTCLLTWSLDDVGGV